MANVKINSRSVSRGIATPGGVLWEWRDTTGNQIKRFAQGLSPVNDPLDAAHRAGVVGRYKAAWVKTNGTASLSKLSVNVTNLAEHASVVEYGRNGSRKMQFFASRASGGVPRWHSGTRGRAGQFVLTDATNLAMSITSTMRNPLPRAG